jgi:FtsZ-interacting cell division protein YlmF
LIDVGRQLKHADPVLLDLAALAGPVKRRMLDACAGVMYGLDASMTRTMSDRYLLERAPRPR